VTGNPAAGRRAGPDAGTKVHVAPGRHAGSICRVFVGEEAQLDVGFAAAQEGLARLVGGGWLADASHAAYGDGITGLTRVGPLGSVRGMSRLVKVHLSDPVVSHDSARLAVRWEAAGPGSSLFPALDADVVLTPAGTKSTKLRLDGVYRPPLGLLGAGLDQAVLNRVATATIRDFVGRIGQAITTPAADSPPDCRITAQDQAGRQPPEPQTR
jgi:hypothetical protein